MLASDKIQKLKCKIVLYINLNRNKWDIILHDVIYDFAMYWTLYYIIFEIIVFQTSTSPKFSFFFLIWEHNF